MSEFTEMTEEQLERTRELLDLQLEQIRVGKKDNEQAIKNWLLETKKGKAIAGVTKATSTLTKGFVDSATALADSTGDFGSLSGAVGGTVKSMTGLAGAVSNVFGAIPFAGQALDALGDATIAFTKFGMAELQKTFNTFQGLSEAGQMGAGGIEEMAKRMAATNMPLATYSKLLKENSTDLAFLSKSALAGGKTFSKTMIAMASDTGMPLRRLGLSVAEIGDTVVDFQVMQRRQGILDQLSQAQIKKGTEEYARELDLIAKLTGKNRKEVQKEREETMSDSRFRAAMMDRSQEEQQQHMDAIAQISDPTLKRAYMDQVSGFTNSTASITAEISGMGGSIRAAIAHIDDLGGNSTEAVNIMREQARAVTETGGVLQSYSKVVESGGGVMMNFAQLHEFSVQTLKSQKDAYDAQTTQMASVGSAADGLAKGMREMQKGTSIMNSLFTETATAANIMGDFAKMQTEIMTYAKALLNDENPGSKILDDAKNALQQKLWEETAGIRKTAGNIEGFIKELVYGKKRPKQEAPGTFSKPLLTFSGSGENAVPSAVPDMQVATGEIPKNVTADSHSLTQAREQFKQEKFEERANFNSEQDANGWTSESIAYRRKMEQQNDRMNETLEKILNATTDGISANKDVGKNITRAVQR